MEDLREVLVGRLGARPCWLAGFVLRKRNLDKKVADFAS